jgi:methenyltetrahydrofolate cyclohydrolase
VISNDYLEWPLGRFLDELASGEPTPGGGAAAALAVALGAGLVAMAARFSAKRMPDASELAEQADALRARVAPLAQADASAYTEVLAAYRAPHEPGRDALIHAALAKAADVPRVVGEVGAEVARLADRVAREGNPNLRGDALAASQLAQAGVRIAENLVEINTAAAQQ